MQNAENPQTHFIQVFKVKDAVLGPLILQFQEVLLARADTDSLKNRNVLNPVDDGDLMGLPAYRSVKLMKDILFHNKFRNLSVAFTK